MNVLDVSVNQESIGLRMNVLHHHLETVESPCLWNLYLSHESLSQVFKNNSITGRKETKNMLYKMLFVLSKTLPIFKILTKINFFSGPEACLLVFIALPNVIIFDWQNDKSIWVILKKWLWKKHLCLGEALCLGYVL